MSLIIQMEYHFSTFIAILGRTQACDMTSNIPQNVCGMAQASIGAFPPPPSRTGLVRMSYRQGLLWPNGLMWLQYMTKTSD